MTTHTYQERGETLWRGRQWAVTTYGLETWGEPYHYHMEIGQIRALRPGEKPDVLDSMLHMMEKNWLDVDDFLTAYMVALTLHGGEINGTTVRNSIQEALQERAYLYAPKPDQIPMPPGQGVLTMSELVKFLPEPPWTGSKIIGVVLGGIADQGPTPAEDDDEDDDD